MHGYPDIPPGTGPPPPPEMHHIEPYVDSEPNFNSFMGEPPLDHPQGPTPPPTAPSNGSGPPLPPPPPPASTEPTSV